MDNSFAGPMTMIKIDGAKIKLLREQQGLTQLYLATAVEVTTDTISRWENRRYPSIKRDNGLKLAEALNVQLEDILEEVLEEEHSPEIISPPEDLPHTGSSNTAGTSMKKKWTLSIFSGVLFCAVIFFSWYFLHSPSPRPLTAKRILPGHCISGQPFPVIIQVIGTPGTTTSLIIKESIPKSGTIHAMSPKVTAGSLKNNQIKWLKKIEGSSIFAYVVSLTGKEGEEVHFSGTAANSIDSETPLSGRDTIIISHYHWADTDMNNVISDDEILAVYDRYSDISDIDLDIDLIEEIWLGSSYQWDPDSASFKIFD